MKLKVFLHPNERSKLGRSLWAGLLLALLMLQGCATGPNANPKDPLEPFNRGVYKFNDVVDTAVLKPVATVYQGVVPNLMRKGVNNFFANIQDAWSFVNNTLQLKGQDAADSLSRFGINTFIGMGGIFDIASDLQIQKHTKDFGHTLGYWGVGPGPYIVLPLLGSSTLRDTVALPVDINGDLVSGISDVPTRNTLTVTRVIDTRANLLKASSMLEEAALDKYAFTREAYLQRRRSAIYDGNPPDEQTSENDYEEQDAALPQTEAVATKPADTLNTAGIPGDEKVKP